MNGLVLSAFVSIGTPQGYILPDQDAPRYAAKAIYKELGWDEHVKRIEKRHLPKWAKDYGGYVGLGIRIATEKRVSYTWKF